MRIANVNEAMYGKEPDAKTSSLSTLLDYYAQAHTKEEKKKWFLSYFESPSSEKTGTLKMVASLPDSMFASAGTLARIWMRGLKSNEVYDKLLEFEEKLVADGRKHQNQTETEEAKKARLKELTLAREAQDQISFVDSQIDSFIENGYKSNFNMASWAKSVKVSTQTMDKIRARVEKLRDELIESATDPDLAEGYSHITKRKKRDFIEFLDSIASHKITKAVSSRKPRKTKAKTPEKLVKNLKFLKEFKDLKLTSIDPTDIIGATSLWVYNTKYRVLTNYLSDKGLSVKGSTLLNMSDESVGKKVRKPEQVVSAIATMGKVPLRKVLDGLTTTAISPNGRINKDIVLLRAIK